MIQIEKILDQAVEKDASDVHLIAGIKPMLRIARDLVVIGDMDNISAEDMWEVYV